MRFASSAVVEGEEIATREIGMEFREHIFLHTSQITQLPPSPEEVLKLIYAFLFIEVHLCLGTL